MKIVVFGAGNVSWHLTQALAKTNEIVQVYSRTLENARALAERVGATACDSLDDITADADCYIISVVDDAIEPIAKHFSGFAPDALWVHTSGSRQMSALEGVSAHYGVLYPLQTFTKSASVNVTEIPFFIEGNTAETTDAIKALAGMMSTQVFEADSDRRKRMHIAAVFASNFANALWRIADEELSKDGIPFSVLMPLIRASVEKLCTVTPEQGQTGPARRGDVGILRNHLSMLEGENQEIYRLLSENILKHYNHNSKL